MPCARDLNGLAREHRRYLADFEALRANIDSATIAQFASAYRAFSAAMGEHEQREEELLSSLEGEADPPTDAGEGPAREARSSR